MQVAQINIAKMLAPADDPIMAGFVDNLERINALADKSSGFIWRLTGEADNALAVQVFENDFLIINMSVWEDIESLHDYVYKTVHSEFIRNKKEWFTKLGAMHMALWWIEDGAYPTPQIGKKKIDLIQSIGPSQEAFTFKHRFEPI